MAEEPVVLMKGPKLSCKLNVLSRPDGSALFCEGETMALAAVYGPIEAKPNLISIEKASVEVHVRPKSGQATIKERFHENQIQGVCENTFAIGLHPRSAFIVSVQELHDDGQLLSCCINAICLAALQARIDMECMFAAVTIFLNSNNGELTLIPPTKKSDIQATLVIVYNSQNGNIIMSHTKGEFNKKQYSTALGIGKRHSSTIFEFFKQSLDL